MQIYKNIPRFTDCTNLMVGHVFKHA